MTDPTASQSPEDLDTSEDPEQAEAAEDEFLDDGDIDDGDIVDELPEDLDMAGFVGPRVFPNNNRRRIPAAIYLLAGLAAVALYASKGDASPLVNRGILWAGVALVIFGAYGLVAGWTLHVEETDALQSAARYVKYPVGHAAAQMVWRGWLSRPTWRILAYSDDDPPSKRAMVIVDGISGDVVEGFSEDNPEDWSVFADSERSISDS